MCDFVSDNLCLHRNVSYTCTYIVRYAAKYRSSDRFFDQSINQSISLPGGRKGEEGSAKPHPNPRSESEALVWFVTHFKKGSSRLVHA